MKIAWTCLYVFLGTAINGVAIEHPHLLFTREELPAIREMIEKQEIPARAWTNILNRCKSIIKSGTYEKIGYTPLDVRPYDPLTTLLFAWHFSGDTKYRDEFLNIFHKARSERFDFSWYDTPLIFDLGYDLFTQEERNFLKKIIVKITKLDYNFEDWGYYSNWALCRDSVPVFAMASLWGEPEFDEAKISQYAAQVRIFFNAFISPDGLPSEGWTYLDYGLNVRGALTIEMMRRKGFDFVKGTNLDKIPAALIQSSVPNPINKLMILPFGDARRSYNSIFSITLLARLMPNHPLIPFLLRDCARDDSQNFSIIGGIVLFPRDLSPAPTDAPYPADIKLSAFYPYDAMMCARNEWGTNAFFFAVQAKKGGGHAHEDAGSFIMDAKGCPWVIDPGYGKYDMGGHNAVLIDKEGNKTRGGNAGVILSTMNSPYAAFFNVDLADCWNIHGGNWRYPVEEPIAKNQRAIAAIMDDPEIGVPAYAMVFDNVRKDKQLREYTQVFQFDKDVAFEFTNAQASVTYTNIADKTLIVRPFSPNDAKLSILEHKDFGRFPEDFKRMDISAQAVEVVFATALLPLTAEIKTPTFTNMNEFNFKCRIDWEHATDFWIWKDRDTLNDNNCPEFGMVRSKKRTKDLAAIDSYFMFNVGGMNLSMGRELMIRRWEVTGKRRMFYEDVACRANIAWQNHELYVEVFTPVNAQFQTSRVNEYEVYAPEAKRVVCNGVDIPFKQIDDKVVFTAKSTVPGILGEMNRRRHQVLYDAYQESWIKYNTTSKEVVK